MGRRPERREQPRGLAACAREDHCELRCGAALQGPPMTRLQRPVVRTRVPAPVRLFCTAFVEQFGATAVAYVGVYLAILVPRLSGMNRIGDGWLVLLALPTLAVTVHLSALGERFRDVCALALGSSLGLCALLMLCSALETTGFREARPLDEPVGQWTTLAFS